MAGREIKQTIRLDGEKEYSAALQSAQRNLRTLRSALKAETAELGANATAQQKSQVRAQSLQKQIAEQEKVVETLRKALAEAKEQYGDNEAVVAKWEQKLNEARATLANMQNDLTQTGNSFKQVGSDMAHAGAEGVTAAKSFADSIGSIGDACTNISSGIEGIFGNIIGAVRDTVTELWDFIGDTAARANNWSDIAGYWGTDAQTIQMYARSVEASANSFDDLQSAVSRIVLGGKGKTIAEIVGISDVNYENDWAYAMAVLNRASELQKNGQLSDDFWTEIFGEKRSTKVMDLLNDWDTIQHNLTTFNADEGGYGMDSDALQTMNDLWVQMTEIETKWGALKDSVAAGLGTITADLLVDVSGSMDALNDYLKADGDEEREAALEKLKGHIENFFSKLGEFLSTALKSVNDIGQKLKESEDPIVAAFGEMLTQVTDALQWLIDNQDAVKKAIEAVFGVWLISKLGSIALKLAGVIAQLGVIKTWSALSGAGAAAGAAGAGAAGAGAAGAAGAGAAGAGAANASVFSGLGTALAGFAGLGSIAAGFWAAAKERLTNFNIRGSSGAIETSIAESENSAEVNEAFIDYVATQRAMQHYLEEGDIDSEEAAKAFEAASASSEAFHGMAESAEVLDRYSAWRQENSFGANDWVLPDTLESQLDEDRAKIEDYLLDDLAGDLHQRASARIGERWGAASPASFDLGGFFDGARDALSDVSAAIGDAGEYINTLYTQGVHELLRRQSESELKGPELPYASPEYVTAINDLTEAMTWWDAPMAMESLKSLAQMGETELIPEGLQDWITNQLTRPDLTDDMIIQISKQAFEAIEQQGGLNYTTQQSYPPGDLESLKGLPGVIARAISNSMSDIRVYMDGTVVGNLVAPAVSRNIAVMMER